MKYRVAVLIVSDRAASGEREDRCLPVFETTLDKNQFEIVEHAVVSDDPVEIQTVLKRLIDKNINLIFTSGGTGCGPRDNTPEVTAQLLDKPTPGLDEAIRRFSQTKSQFAVFSRAVSGVAKQSFIVNLPGSPKAVAEILTFLNPVISHPLDLLSGKIRDCNPSKPTDE